MPVQDNGSSVPCTIQLILKTALCFIEKWCLVKSRSICYHLHNVALSISGTLFKTILTGGHLWCYGLDASRVLEQKELERESFPVRSLFVLSYESALH